MRDRWACMQADREVVQEAVSQDAEALQWASQELQAGWEQSQN